jgi:hypothetical protein
MRWLVHLNHHIWGGLVPLVPSFRGSESHWKPTKNKIRKIR